MTFGTPNLAVVAPVTVLAGLPDIYVGVPTTGAVRAAAEEKETTQKLILVWCFRSVLSRLKKRELKKRVCSHVLLSTLGCCKLELGT